MHTTWTKHASECHDPITFLRLDMTVSVISLTGLDTQFFQQECSVHQSQEKFSHMIEPTTLLELCDCSFTAEGEALSTD